MWRKQESFTGKLNCILQGKNTTVHQLDCMVKNVTDLSLLDSACCPNVTSNTKNNKMKKGQTESGSIFCMFPKF